MRKLLLIFIVFFVTTGAAAVLGRERWPGPHPHALATYRQRWEAREAEWCGKLHPSETPAATDFSQVLSACMALHGTRQVDIDFSYPQDMSFPGWVPGRLPMDPPLELAGRSARATLEGALDRSQFGGQMTFIRTERGMLLTKPESGTDRNLAVIDVSGLHKRWWSPQLLWSRFRTPDGKTPKSHDVLLNMRIEHDVDPESWTSPGTGRSGYGISGNSIYIISTNQNVAAVQDLVWRIKLEAMLFDASIAGLTAASILGGGILIHSAVRRRRRLKAGLCPACGYDLRSSPERCPECGNPR